VNKRKITVNLRRKSVYYSRCRQLKLIDTRRKLKYPTWVHALRSPRGTKSKLEGTEGNRKGRGGKGRECKGTEGGFWRTRRGSEEERGTFQGNEGNFVSHLEREKQRRPLSFKERERSRAY
jgi:hypothetical protein